MSDQQPNPTDQIQELRDEQTKTMLTVLAALSNIPGVTVKDAVWPHLDPEEDHQRHIAAVSFVETSPFRRRAPHD